MEVTIRQAQAEDAEALTEFWNKLILEDGFMNARKPTTTEKFKENLIKNIESAKKGGYIYLLAEVNDNLVGKVKISRNGGRMDHVGVLSISVDKGSRVNGIGKKLMEAALAEAKKLDWKIVKLAVMANNEPAIKLYEKFGFKQFGYLPKGIQKGGEYIDLIEMYKEL